MGMAIVVEVQWVQDTKEITVFFFFFIDLLPLI